MDPESATSICTSSEPLAALGDNPTLFGELRGHPLLVAAVRRASMRLDVLLS